MVDSVGLRWHAGVVWLALLLFAGPSAGDELLIRLAAAKQSLLVGEPLVITVTCETTDVPIEVDDELKYSEMPLRIYVSGPNGQVRHLEEEWASDWPEGTPGIPEGGRVTKDYVLAYNRTTRDWAFPLPGEYSIWASYEVGGEEVARSPAVSITAEAPSGAEAVVYQRLQQFGPSYLGVHSPNKLGSLAGIVEEYPDSVYLPELQLNYLRLQLSDIGNGYDPIDPGDRPDLRPDVVRARKEALLPEAEAFAGLAGQFTPDALLILADLYHDVGQPDLAEATYRRIVEEYPERQAAVNAQEEIGDTLAPSLSLGVEPSSLWPPNHKLGPVTVSVTVSDDKDPEPEVLLESITCDDGCDANVDVSNALFGTDDREFELRAERSGPGDGRTYTITYSATDDGGNKAEATTTVVVPHDQGKKKGQK